jgi:hypothetical protein
MKTDYSVDASTFEDYKKERRETRNSKMGNGSKQIALKNQRTHDTKKVRACEKFINVSCAIHQGEYSKLSQLASQKNISVSAYVKQYLDNIIDGTIDKIDTRYAAEKKTTIDKHWEPKLIGCSLKQSRLDCLDQILKKSGITRYQLIKS